MEGGCLRDPGASTTLVASLRKGNYPCTCAYQNDMPLTAKGMQALFVVNSVKLHLTISKVESRPIEIETAVLNFRPCTEIFQHATLCTQARTTTNSLHLSSFENVQ